MPTTDAETEQRVKTLESGMRELREEVTKLKDSLNSALLGTTDGKPGIISTLHSLLDARKADAIKLDALAIQIDSLRLDRAKIAGIVAAVIAVLGIVYKLFLK